TPTPRRPPPHPPFPYTTLFRSRPGYGSRVAPEAAAVDRSRPRRPARRRRLVAPPAGARQRRARPPRLTSRPVGAQVLETARQARSEEHTSELQSQSNLVCRLLL